MAIAVTRATIGVASGVVYANDGDGPQECFLKVLTATEIAYIGPGTVTTANGFPIQATDLVIGPIKLNPGEPINGIRGAAADVNVAILRYPREARS